MLISDLKSLLTHESQHPINELQLLVTFFLNFLLFFFSFLVSF